jgi:hypothetical protein
MSPQTLSIRLIRIILVLSFLAPVSPHAEARPSLSRIPTEALRAQALVPAAQLPHYGSNFSANFALYSTLHRLTGYKKVVKKTAYVALSFSTLALSGCATSAQTHTPGFSAALISVAVASLGILALAAVNLEQQRPEERWSYRLQTVVSPTQRIRIEQKLNPVELDMFISRVERVKQLYPELITLRDLLDRLYESSQIGVNGDDPILEPIVQKVFNAFEWLPESHPVEASEDTVASAEQFLEGRDNDLEIVQIARDVVARAAQSQVDASEGLKEMLENIMGHLRRKHSYAGFSEVMNRLAQELKSMSPQQMRSYFILIDGQLENVRTAQKRQKRPLYYGLVFGGNAMWLSMPIAMAMIMHDVPPTVLEYALMCLFLFGFTIAGPTMLAFEQVGEKFTATILRNMAVLVKDPDVVLAQELRRNPKDFLSDVHWYDLQYGPDIFLKTRPEKLFTQLEGEPKRNNKKSVTSRGGSALLLLGAVLLGDAVVSPAVAAGDVFASSPMSSNVVVWIIGLFGVAALATFTTGQHFNPEWPYQLQQIISLNNREKIERAVQSPGDLEVIINALLRIQLMFPEEDTLEGLLYRLREVSDKPTSPFDPRMPDFILRIERSLELSLASRNALPGAPQQTPFRAPHFNAALQLVRDLAHSGADAAIGLEAIFEETSALLRRQHGMEQYVEEVMQRMVKELQTMDAEQARSFLLLTKAKFKAVRTLRTSQSRPTYYAMLAGLFTFWSLPIASAFDYGAGFGEYMGIAALFWGFLTVFLPTVWAMWMTGSRFTEMVLREFAHAVRQPDFTLAQALKQSDSTYLPRFSWDDMYGGVGTFGEKYPEDYPENRVAQSYKAGA